MRSSALALSLLLLGITRQAAAVSQPSSSAVSAPACGVSRQLSPPPAIPIRSAWDSVSDHSQLSCTVSYVLKSTCSLSNITCICNNVPLSAQISLCVVQNCTVHEQLRKHLCPPLLTAIRGSHEQKGRILTWAEMQNYSRTTCGVEPRDRSTLIWLFPAIFGPIAVIAFAFRVAARVVAGFQTWGWDDSVMAITMVRISFSLWPYSLFAFRFPLSAFRLLIGDFSSLSSHCRLSVVLVSQRVPASCLPTCSLTSCAVSRLGLGRDIWTITPKNITSILHVRMLTT